MKNSRTVVTAVSFYIALAGLVSTVLPIIVGGFDFYRSTAYTIISNFLPFVHFGYLDTTDFTFWFENMGIDINVCNIVYYLLFLVAAIIFGTRGFRDSRLLAFCYSLLMINSVIMFLQVIVYMTTIKDSKFYVKAMLLSVVALIVTAGWFVLSLYMIRLMQKSNNLLTKVYAGDEISFEGFVKASAWQRLLHYLVDYIILLLIVTPFIFDLGRYYFRNTNYFREDWWLYVFMIPFLLIYYMLFEALVGATPSKFLTATRVADDFGGKPKFGSVIGRTFARLVPFEPLSFLGGFGWHDAWTDTYVLKENRRGFKDNIYWLIFPLIIVLAIGTYYVLDWFSVR